MLASAGRNEILQGIQRLVKVNSKLEKGIKALGGRADGNAYRKELNDALGEGMLLVKQIGNDLKSYNESNKSKLAKDYETQMKKLQMLGKELSTKERQIMVRLSLDADENIANPSPYQEQEQEIPVYVLENETFSLEERANALREIESDVRQVNEMMKDMAMMVEEQQEMLDHIESNVEKTTENVKLGENEIKIVSSYRIAL